MIKNIFLPFLLALPLALGCGSQPVAPPKVKLPLLIQDDAKHRSDVVFPIHTKKGKWGVIDIEGNIVVQRTYAKASWGFSSDNGDLVEHCGQQGILLTSSKKWCYVNSNGAHFIEPQFDKIWRINNYGESLFGLELNPMTFELNPDFKGHSAVIDPAFVYDPYDIWNPPEGVLPHNRLSEGLLVVSLGRKFGYANRTGELIIEPAYESASPFSEGLAAIQQQGKWGFIDKQGVVIVKPQYERVQAFDEGIAPVKINDHWIFINLKGEKVIDWPHKMRPFVSEGLAILYDPQKKFQGYCLPTGEWEIPPLYRHELFFSDGIAGVWADDPAKSGYINRKGELEIALPNAGSMSFFCHGLAWIGYKNPTQDCGYINRKGEWIWLAEWVKDPPEVIYNH